MFLINALMEDISVGTAGLVALLGYAVVFVGLIALMAVNPRRIFGLGGGLHVGDQADFTVLDLDARYRVDPATFLSMGRATPFAGWEVQGRAAMTVVGGREVFTDEVMKTNR